MPGLGADGSVGRDAVAGESARSSPAAERAIAQSIHVRTCWDMFSPGTFKESCIHRYEALTSIYTNVRSPSFTTYCRALWLGGSAAVRGLIRAVRYQVSHGV